MKILAVALCVLAVAVTGCSRPLQPRTAQAAETDMTAGQRIDQATAEAKRIAANAVLTAKVKTALANDVGLKTLKIEVDSNEGVVSLKGAVDSEDTKRRSERVTQAVEGVKSVENRLSVGS